jgi:hypothetical protein
VRERLAELAGLKRAELSAAKTNVVDSLDPASLAEFLAEAAPPEIKKLAKLPFGHLPAERVQPLYEATHAPAVKARNKAARTVEMFRMLLAPRLDSRLALDALTRHPDDGLLVQQVRGVGTVGELRRAVALTAPAAPIAEALCNIDGAPDDLSVSTAEALARIGCTWKPAPAERRFPRVHRSGGGDWSGEDPRNELTPCGAGWLVANCCVFPTRTFQFKFREWDTAPSTLRLGDGGETIDIDVKDRRRILGPVGCIEETQYYLSVDLADSSPHLQLYSIDHDGTGAAHYMAIGTFAYVLTR